MHPSHTAQAHPPSPPSCNKCWIFVNPADNSIILKEVACLKLSDTNYVLICLSENSEFNCFLIWFVRDLILTLKTLFLALARYRRADLCTSTLYNPCECDKCDANEPQQNTDTSDNNKMVLFALLCMQISLPTLLKYLLVTRLLYREMLAWDLS